MKGLTEIIPVLHFLCRRVCSRLQRWKQELFEQTGGQEIFIRLRSDNRMVSHDEISKLWEGAIMENHSLYNLIAKMGKVLSVDTRIELVTVGKDGYALK